MQTFLKILGFITIFIGIIIGIYVIADALNVYAASRTANNPYFEQVYVVKLVAGGAIIMSSIVSGMLYLSFGIVIELLDSISQKLDKPEPKKTEEDEFSY
jgi:preprotein translocase subunit SecY